MLKKKSIKEIWNDTPIKNFRKMLAEKELKTPTVKHVKDGKTSSVGAPLKKVIEE